LRGRSQQKPVSDNLKQLTNPITQHLVKAEHKLHSAANLTERPEPDLLKDDPTPLSETFADAKEADREARLMDCKNQNLDGVKTPQLQVLNIKLDCKIACPPEILLIPVPAQQLEQIRRQLSTFNIADTGYTAAGFCFLGGALSNLAAALTVTSSSSAWWMTLLFSVSALILFISARDRTRTAKTDLRRIDEQIESWQHTHWS
jgi:hypothetical protein